MFAVGLALFLLAILVFHCFCMFSFCLFGLFYVVVCLFMFLRVTLVYVRHGRPTLWWILLVFDCFLVPIGLYFCTFFVFLFFGCSVLCVA